MHRTQGDNYVLDSDGNRVFTESVPPTTVKADWLNSVQEEISTAIENSGQELAVDGLTDLNNQLSSAIQRSAAYDAIVTSQETFNALWERVSANVYKIKDDVGSVYFKTPAGGFYQLSAGSSPLSDGDTWGQYQTNQATFILCDGSCYFQMGDTPGYIDVNASNTIVYNMDVRGIGASASAITTSIHIDSGADNCKLLFPTVKDRLSNSGSSYAIRDESDTALIIGGHVSNIDSSVSSTFGIIGFDRIIGCIVENCTITGLAPSTMISTSGSLISSCLVKSITSTGANGMIGFSAGNISNCAVDDITGYRIKGFVIGLSVVGCSSSNFVGTSAVYGFYICDGISGCTSDTISSSGDVAYGFYRGDNLSGNKATAISSTSNTSSGFYDCDNLSGCEANTITSSANSAYGFNTCNNLSGNKADIIQYTGTSSSYKAYGFYNCDRIASCEAKTIQATGANGYAYGFSACNNLSANIADTITAVTASHTWGYHTCNNVSSSCSATAVDDTNFYLADCWAKKVLATTCSTVVGTQTIAHGCGALQTNFTLRDLSGIIDSSITGNLQMMENSGLDIDDTNVYIDWTKLTSKAVGNPIRINIEYQK